MSCRQCFAVSIPSSRPPLCPECFAQRGSKQPFKLPEAIGLCEKELGVGEVMKGFPDAWKELGSKNPDRPFMFSFFLTDIGDIAAVSDISGVPIVWVAPKWVPWEKYMVHALGNLPE